MAGELIGLGLMVLAAPGVAIANAIARKRHRARWVEAATAAGLRQIEPATAPWSSGILTARAGFHRVRIETYSRSKYNHGTRVVIDGNSGLTLRAEKDVSMLERMVGRREIEIGDGEFDHEVYIEGGDPPVLRALLDVETRGLVRRFLEGLLRKVGGKGGLVAARASVLDGSVVFEVHTGNDEALCADFADVIQGPLELARRLERPRDVYARLVENTEREPHPGMRLENIKALARAFPPGPAARPLLAQGCDDENQEIQLQCALALGPDDPKGGATLAEIATRGWSDDPLAASAIVTLGARLPFDRIAATLNQALRVRSLETARACLQVLGESTWPQAVDTLAKVLGVEKGELAAAAARALGGGPPAGEAPLLKALHAVDGDVRLGAVEALGRMGGAAAVIPLKQAAERDGDLRRAVRQAIAAIHERVGATPGQVSLAGGEAGTLTLTGEDDAAGRLSIDKP